MELLDTHNLCKGFFNPVLGLNEKFRNFIILLIKKSVLIVGLVMTSVGFHLKLLQIINPEAPGQKIRSPSTLPLNYMKIP